ncbi:TonB-dependent receptor [Aquimarina sp. AD10]|uniref:Ferric enterobactin receptor n=1 Tax=Aquimarina aggregata TaxID=1642818 RepID=A0A163C7N2_9FLAO|nr:MULTISPECIES: TonB-dependent receptor [Aquimarina]AXT59882.1 TonB-dependent receptor [Aquimarina sp. AD10]KZS42130.1 ferric enterobactin receptor [Aquimarina aggregata]RKN00201.1 TonB-dependent receptor [Aquimarina sp. AD10]
MKKLTFILFVLSVCFGFSQQTVTGVIRDADGSPLPGVNIIEKGTSNGATTDFDGKYSIDVSNAESILIFSYVGFNTQEISVNSKTVIDVTLASGAQLEEIILVGSRALPRSNTTSSLPVDVLPANELVSTGQITFDKALQYKIPSFNTVQTPVNDATSLLDPYEIRNMGPSRTLILVNGKRKNLSALLYTQTSPGRGETGADISAIPTDAIKRVEILRDGASAQYGSDAIAGVMNIVLKDNPEEGSVTFRSGITSEGDGETIGISLNNGAKIGDDKGFFNYTIDFSKVSLANRPGDVDAEGEFSDFGGTRVGERLEDIRDFLSRRPDAGNINGSPETAASKFLVNGGYDISENTEIYMNAAYVYKKVNSFANFRTPYWRDIQDFPYLADFFPNGPGGSYEGYLPTFEGDLNDYNATVGFKTKKNGWNYDLSYTTGGNTQTYSVNNTHNGNSVLSPLTWNDANNDGIVDPGEVIGGADLYRERSPISFDPGGTRFSHNVGNIDIAKLLSDQVSIGFGAEFRNETFEIIEGDLASYDGGGSDSFAGNRPENSGKFNRYNFGGYFDISADITEDFLVNGTIRLEDYSDFGEAFVWKLSSRYKFLEDKLTLRASVSTGFRAPTLHQIFTQRAQFSFVPGQGIQVGGLINNVSPQARLLDIPQLDAEESTNITVGIGAKINRNINFTIDYYNIAVDDRIVLSTEIGATAAGNTPLDDVLTDNNLSDVSFFVNAIDTRTSGIDLVANYKNIELGTGKLGFSLSGNYTLENERDGDVKNPALVAQAGQSVVNDTQEALFFTSRPEFKAILGANYDIGKFGFSLNNTLFGPTKFRNQGLQDLEGLVGGDAADSDGGSDLGVEFMTKVVTDLAINYSATDKLTIALNVNNILDVLPEWEFEALTPTGTAVLNDPAAEKTAFNLITFNGRYSQMSYDGYHFSQLGTMINLSLNYKL